MTIFITQFPRTARSIDGSAAPSLPALSNTPLSSGTTLALSTITAVIGVQADAGAWLFLGSSASTGLPSSTTNSVRIPANQPMLFFNVSPLARLIQVTT